MPLNEEINLGDRQLAVKPKGNKEAIQDEVHLLVYLVPNSNPTNTYYKRYSRFFINFAKNMMMIKC